jgi:hypothetical protein
MHPDHRLLLFDADFECPRGVVPDAAVRPLFAIRDHAGVPFRHWKAQPPVRIFAIEAVFAAIAGILLYENLAKRRFVLRG